MKSNLHPKYDFLEVVHPSGKTFVTRSTRPGKINLESSPENHVAWVGGNSKDLSVSARSKSFVDKYKNFGKI